MAVRDGRGDVKQTTAGFRVLLMVQSLTSAKSKFLSLTELIFEALGDYYYEINDIPNTYVEEVELGYYKIEGGDYTEMIPLQIYSIN